MSLRNYTALPTLTSITTALAASTSGTADSVTVASTTNFPAAPFTAGIERGQPNEECVLVTAVNTSTKVLTITRGYDGTAAPAHAAATTTTFEHVVSAIDYREANAHINSGVSAGHGQVQNADIAGGAVDGNKIAGNAVGQGHVSYGYVDLANPQTVGGAKAFSAALTTQSGLYNNSAELFAVNNGAASGRARITDDGTFAFIQTDRTLRVSPMYSGASRMDIDPAGNVTTGGSIASNGQITAQSTTPSTGYAFLTPGDTSHSGYIGFQGSNNVRQGYIGWVSSPSGSGDQGTLQYQAGQHNFTGAVVVPSVAVGGTSTLSGRTSSYGSLMISGSAGGWAGITFGDMAPNQTMMMNGSAFGVYDAASGAWRWRFDGPAAGTPGAWALTTGTIDVGSVTGTNARGYVTSVGLGASGATTGAVVWNTAVAVVNGRRYRVTYQIFDIQTTVANDRFSYALAINSAATGQGITIPHPTTLTGGLMWTFFFTAGTTGNVNVGISITRATGTGTCNLNGGTVTVEDIG